MINVDHDALHKLWKSTKQFHERFRGAPPPVGDTIKPFYEEALELGKAVFRETPERAADEAADVVVTIMGILQALHVTRDEFENALERVAAKNDAKTHETHFVRDDGKIARRGQIA